MIDLGEALADIENRLSFLERLHELSNNPSEPIEERLERLEQQQPTQDYTGRLAELDSNIKWKLHKIREINLTLEKIDELTTKWLTIIERNKIPVKVVEIPRSKMETLPIPRLPLSADFRGLLELRVLILDVRKEIKQHLHWHKEKVQPRGKY